VKGITNAKLANSSVTVTAGSALTGGGAVALGASATLDVAAKANLELIATNGIDDHEEPYLLQLRGALVVAPLSAEQAHDGEPHDGEPHDGEPHDEGLNRHCRGVG
jgi:hypothetical protein